MTSIARRPVDVEVTSAADAADLVEPGDTVLVSGFGSVGYPKAVPSSLAGDARDLDLTLVSGGSVGPEIDAELVESGQISRRFPYQARSPAREAVNDGSIAFHDRNIAAFGDEIRYGWGLSPDVAIVEAIAVGPDWLIPSTSIGHTPAFVGAADRLIVELNRTQPVELAQIHDVYRRRRPPDRSPIPLERPDQRIGSPKIEFDPAMLAAVVETQTADEPYVFRDPTATDLEIAANLGDFLAAELASHPVFADAIHLQFGVGSLGNALMGELGRTDFGDRAVYYYGEVIQDGLLDLIDDDTLAGASATSLALSAAGQERLFETVGRYAESLTLRPADVSNDPGIIDRFGVVSVNSALEVDIYGNANATHATGTRMLNGIGGGGDFVQNALVSVIALPSILHGGDTSRIVPFVPHVDHTEHNVDVIITEQGVADLRAKSPRERAEAVIECCAHPSYREELRDYFEAARASGGQTPHDLSRAFSDF